MSERCDAGWTEQEHADAREEVERLRLALASAKGLLATAQRERDEARAEVERILAAGVYGGLAFEKLARARQLADQWSREYRDNARQFARELRAVLNEEVGRDEPRP